MPEYEMREEFAVMVDYGDGKPIPLVFLHPKAIVTEIQYPKSLGELCLECRAEELQKNMVHEFEPLMRLTHLRWTPNEINARTYQDDCDALRVAMYHKNRSEE